MKTYTLKQKVRFGHIDALGIAFYPRLIEMLNNTVESFFEDVVGYSYKEMHIKNNNGVPTVKLDVEFKQSVCLEDVVTWELQVVEVKRSSFTFSVNAKTNDIINMTSVLTLVYVEGSADNLKSIPLTDQIRNALIEYLH